MIIVKVFGGLGNELFQYALYRKLQISGREVYGDISYLIRLRENGFPTIDLFPKMKLQVVDEEERERLGDVSRSIIAKIRRKFWRKKSHIREDVKTKYFQKEILRMDEVYLDGYWQSDLYFSDIREELLVELEFPEVHGQKNRELVLKMREKNSVSIHFRRGDYLQGKLAEIYGEACPDSYYKNAIDYFRREYQDVHFYMFSNDPDWVRKQYSGFGMTIVDWNLGRNSYWDMYLMSQCKHNIIANSSFSWWGAWLNKNKDKKVIAPGSWFNPKFIVEKDIVCKEWIRM